MKYIIFFCTVTYSYINCNDGGPLSPCYELKTDCNKYKMFESRELAINYFNKLSNSKDFMGVKLDSICNTK